MIKITTTQTLLVSDENEPFIQLLINWKTGMLEGETQESAIGRILSIPIQESTRILLESFLTQYFGLAGQTQSKALMESIDNGALTTNTIITRT